MHYINRFTMAASFEDLQTLSASALALVSLLRPLRWAGPLISTLPSELYEYLDSPVPLILGVVSLPLHFEQGPDMVLVFADEDRVRLPPKLLSDPGAHLAIQLPRLSQLRHDLAPHCDRLRPLLLDGPNAAEAAPRRPSPTKRTAAGDDRRAAVARGPQTPELPTMTTEAIRAGLRGGAPDDDDDDGDDDDDADGRCRPPPRTCWPASRRNHP